MLVEKFCNSCKKKIGEEEREVSMEEYRNSTKGKHYCEDCKVEEVIEKKDIYLSPTSINTFYQCPYLFFKTHIEKVPIEKTIHLVKGTIVHNSLEKWFDEFENNLPERMNTIFERQWSINPDLKKLKLTKEEIDEGKKDAKRIVDRFVTKHLDKMEDLLEAGKAENLRHSWFLLRPKFNEVKLDSKELRVRGRADRIFTNFDNMTILADYKTSNRYGIGITEDQRRQVSIYAYLYQEQEKKPLDYVSIIFLRFGEEPMVEVTPSLIKYARDCILYVREKTKSENVKDYCKKMSALCQYCSFKDDCDGTNEFLSEKRKAKMRKMATKK